MLSQGRLKRSLAALFVAFCVIAVFFVVHTDLYHKVYIPKIIPDKPEPTGPPPKPIYKPDPGPSPEIVDNFPLAASAKSPSDLPPIPKWNAPPDPHLPEKTPLFIGFTRNWRLLQQVVVSYVTAGWPPGDIYVIENTGTMNSNKDGKLSLQNPFYIDHHRLTDIFRVNVITTPTLLTFAQLQNFFTYTALEKGWEHYFWAHMDSPAVSEEEYKGEPYKSIYVRAVDVMRETMAPEYGLLAARWFAYDRLSLVRTQAFIDVGGWDTQIPFYMTDCDMHERLWMRDFKIENAKVGLIYDVSSSLDDLEILYRRKPTDNKDTKAEVSRNSDTYKELLKKLDDMQNQKGADKGGRNTWQARQRGGKGEPFYRDSEGFERGVLMTMDFGRKVFEEKWGRGPCNIREAGLKEEDAWRVVWEWEKPEVQQKAKEDAENARKEKEKAEKEKAKEG